MAVTYKDYYATLELPRTASPEEIRKAHRRLARKYHPDLNPGDKQMEEKFKEVQEAYDVLSDPDKRKRYDRLGSNWKSGAEFRPPPGWQEAADGAGGAGDFFNGEQFGDTSEFFEALFGGRGRGFRGRGGAGWSEQGQDLEVDVSITLEEAHRGTTRGLTLEIHEPCPECGGTGIKGRRPCPTCQGTGRRPVQKTLEVTIPPGIRDGTVLRLSGQGEPGTGGQPAGDLLARVRLVPHSRFTINGTGDLTIELPVAPWEAVLGARVPVETLEGPVELTIPPGSQTGQRLRLRGQGLRRRQGGRSDLYARLKVMVPPKPSPAEKELFERLAEVSSFKPR